VFEIYKFWEDGRVVIVAAILIAVFMLSIVGMLTDWFLKFKWMLWIPMIISAFGVILGFIFAFLLNGTGSQTSFGIAMYSLYSLVFTGVGEISILIIRKMINK